MYELYFTAEADANYKALEASPADKARCKAVKKALQFLAYNPRHTSLNTHEFRARPCPHGDKLWEAYAQNHTPGAYRIFFCYPPGLGKAILVVAITKHP